MVPCSLVSLLPVGKKNKDPSAEVKDKGGFMPRLGPSTIYKI